MVIIKVYKSNILVGLFFVWMILDIYAVTTLPVKELAITSTMWAYFAGLFVLGYAISKRNIWDKSILPLYLAIAAFLSLYILLYIARQTYSDDYSILLIMLNLFFFLAVVNYKMESSQLGILAAISLFVSAILLIKWISSGMPLHNFQGDIRNPNIMGVFSSCLLFFNILGFRKHITNIKYIYLIGIAINLIIVYISSARATLLLLATIIGSAIILKVSKRAFSFLFYIVLTFSASFLIVYGKLSNNPHFAGLNNWSKEAFGKSFFSGRQSIWNPALDYALKEPFFGYKAGITPTDFIEGGRFFKHVHNQFLQIFLESGLAGTILFILLLFCIWKVFQKGLNDTVVRWSACFFLGIIIYQTVEISLFGNIEPINMFHWLIIGIGVSRVYNKNVETL